MSNKRLHIALQAVGGIHWIGGANYINSIARSFSFIDEKDRPKLSLLLPKGVDRAPFREALTYATPVESPSALMRHVVGCHSDTLIKSITKKFLSKTTIWRKLREHMQRASSNQLVPLLKGIGADVVFPMQFSPGESFDFPWVGWVPDLQYKFLPDYFPPHVYAAYEQMNQTFAEEAKCLVVSSEDSANTFRKYFPAIEDRLRVFRFYTIPEDEWFAKDPDEEIKAFNIPQPYFIIPNHFLPHKNHELAFQAIKNLRDEGIDIHIVCTGEMNDEVNTEHSKKLRRFIKENKLESSITITGVIPERLRQISLIRGALAIIQPSNHEGWSTVVEEARALGKPLFLSNLAVHCEQNTPKTFFFNQNSSTELSNLIKQHLDELKNSSQPFGNTSISSEQIELIKGMAYNFISICSESQV